MGLMWSLVPSADLVMVIGAGRIGRTDIEAYLAATIANGVRKFGKIIDLKLCELALGRDDLDGVARAMNAYAEDADVGPVALVANTPVNIDLLALLRQRIDPRPVRIFTDIESASEWIASFQGSQIENPIVRQLIQATLSRLYRERTNG